MQKFYSPGVNENLDFQAEDELLLRYRNPCGSEPARDGGVSVNEHAD
ncbi:hypothetical protein E3Z27_10095 [Pseudomonas mediterranea]|nr:hypothetical protein [Pseudomonas mediterranea]QHA82015.1 hypothetical protein E3Z27_10095 [Pseudomonas mediterranea]